MSIISQIFIVIFGFIFSGDFFAMSDGIWSMILVQVTIDSIKNANSNVTICCWPFPIRSIYVPYIFLAFSYIFEHVFFAYLSGYLTGVLYSFGLLCFTEPSRNTIDFVHQLIFKRFENFKSFVRETDGIYSDESINVPQPDPNNLSSEQLTTQVQDRNVTQDQVFPGNGVRLGSDISITQANNTIFYHIPRNTTNSGIARGTVLSVPKQDLEASQK